jgi:outer membrane protein, heavy metal efflux system
MVSRSLALPLALTLAALTFSANARSEGGGLNGFVAEVLARSPQLRARTLQQSALRQEAVAASAYPDPSLSVMVDRVPMGVEMPMVRYQISQMFPWPGKLDLMRDAIERQGDAATAELEVRRLDLRLAAKRGWFMLLLNGKRRQVNRAGHDLAVMIATAALSRYSAGTSDHHEVARAQVEVAALDVEHLNMKGEHTSIIAMLNALRDRPVDTTIAEPGDTPSPLSNETLVKLVERALQRRPELQGMVAMREEALTMARLARKEPLPDLMGSVWLNHNIGAPASFGVMLGATLPVFGVAKQGHRAAAFDARAGSAAQDQAAMRAMIRFEVADALIRVQTATRQVELLWVVALPKSRESFEASLAGYGAARVDIVGLLDARRALQSVELALAETSAMREVALADLERAVGAPIGGATP